MRQRLRCGSLSMQHSRALITAYTSLVAHPTLTTATGVMTSAQACKCEHCAQRADKPWVPDSAIWLSEAALFLTWRVKDPPILCFSQDPSRGRTQDRGLLLSRQHDTFQYQPLSLRALLPVYVPTGVECGLGGAGCGLTPDPTVVPNGISSCSIPVPTKNDRTSLYRVPGASWRTRGGRYKW